MAAFLTPIGHHGNLLVYEPGSYRFTDFVRVGTPLTIILGMAVAWLAPMVWLWVDGEASRILAALPRADTPA